MDKDIYTEVANKVFYLITDIMKINNISINDAAKGCAAFFMTCLEADGASKEVVKDFLDTLYDQFLLHKAENG